MSIEEPTTNNNNDNSHNNDNYPYARLVATISKTQHVCSNCAFTTYSEEKARKHEDRSGHKVYARSYRFIRTANNSNNNNSNNNNNNNNGNGKHKEKEILTEEDIAILTKQDSNHNATTSTSTTTTTSTATAPTTMVIEEYTRYYTCRKCEFITESIEEARQHSSTLGHSCEERLLTTLKPIERYRQWLSKRREEEKEERSRQAKRRKEREYKEFKDQVYEAFSTVIARYYNLARSSACFIGQDLAGGSPSAWRLTYLYEYLDNEPLLRGPELIITQESLMLAVIPTFPSGRYCNRIEKVHVIAVQVL
ncbi:MAG: hypothetical protein QXN32_06620, partial [Candidatus Nitrosocaldus sp.]